MNTSREEVARCVVTSSWWVEIRIYINPFHGTARQLRSWIITECRTIGGERDDHGGKQNKEVEAEAEAEAELVIEWDMNNMIHGYMHDRGVAEITASGNLHEMA